MRAFVGVLAATLAVVSINEASKVAPYDYPSTSVLLYSTASASSPLLSLFTLDNDGSHDDSADTYRVSNSAPPSTSTTEMVSPPRSIQITETGTTAQFTSDAISPPTSLYFPGGDASPLTLDGVDVSTSSSVTFGGWVKIISLPSATTYDPNSPNYSGVRHVFFQRCQWPPQGARHCR